MPAVAYIALGSNLGDRETNLRGAVDTIDAHPHVRVNKVSSFIDTEPVGGPRNQPRYLNGVAELSTDLSPRALLDLLLAVETEFGRTRTVPNAPRTLDLDLLLFDGLRLDTPELTIPHPRMHERRFVLQPLAEIAPDVIHPRLGQRARDILESL